MRSRRLALVAVCALVASGCAGSSVIPTGSVTGCFRAIPAARAAVRDPKASLQGVHRIPVDRVRGQLAAALADSGLSQDTPVCAVAFKGSFAPGQVAGAQPGAAGSYAVVVITASSLHLVTSYVTDHLPAGLGRRLL